MASLVSRSEAITGSVLDALAGLAPALSVPDALESDRVRGDLRAVAAEYHRALAVAARLLDSHGVAV